MKRNDGQRDGLQRRGFLRNAGLGGIGAAAGASLGLPGEAEAYETPEEQVKPRYRLTPHIERFYFLNKL